MNKTLAAKNVATEILTKQKDIESLRKAVREAKTRVNDAKRCIKDYSAYLKDSTNPEHIKSLIAEYEAKLAKAIPALEKAQAELAVAEASVPARKPSKFENVLKWFSGASLAKAQAALELLDASLAHGSWIPGASRKVRAAVGKANVAKKTVQLDRAFGGPKEQSAVSYAVGYGSFDGLGRLTVEEIESGVLTGKALQYALDFKPLVDTLDRLDATRPVPTFTKLNASPTVSAELERQGAVAVDVAPLKYEVIENTDPKTGKKTYRTVVYIVWPEGIEHRTSRYARGTAHNNQCHACGHAIKNAYNWVPLVLTDKSGAKKSLWVGRDCAETLFGVKLTGELELAEGQR